MNIENSPQQPTPIKVRSAYFRFLERDCFPPARAAFSSFRVRCFFFSANRPALVSYLIFFAEVAFFLDAPDAVVDFGFPGRLA